ncbi:sigma-54-dependent Fis family transcriptional regulator [Rickettsiales endosymbiont of Peranema trichophorum]|uniref:sigma-54-dependent transcriptional regulator n=1 Tax=Rickettsiales endosymbiont of Peranema trichophorum TaxID=2486577 RepID=UPI00102395E6|nr:sigma-54 dependent transcriptional regulator [Rickettsiales endosymbiont of Peranema trichophorum]RZI47464.1 sigma-54-dependent Fis family transcriptional regulator [Rickettsiales endosymbiont of Peranema trichophorum]
MAEVLIVEDEFSIGQLTSEHLRDEGYEVVHVLSAGDAIKYFEAGNTPSGVILDIWLEGSNMDGIGLLKYIKSRKQHIPVIMVSGHGNIETAIQSVRLGAYDFIEKPFKAEKLLIVLQRAIEASILSEENTTLKEQYLQNAELIGVSKSIGQLKRAALLAAASSSRIMIYGSHGSGKTALARLIHEHSHRSRKPFHILCCSNLQVDEIESELFGIETKKKTKQGILEKCHQGTLMLDEISEMPLSIQGKLLQFLQCNTLHRLGSDKEIKVDVRVIGASSKNVDEELNSGRLNQSLYYRLNVIPLTIEPLTKRKEDIQPLIEHFIKHFATTLNLTSKILLPETIAIMEIYDWPGNVRQLSNVIEWLYIMLPHDTINISPDMLPDTLLNSLDSKHCHLNPITNEMLNKELKIARELFERDYLTAQLSKFGWNISKTAAFIGMDRTALHRKIRSLNIVLLEQKL